MIISVLGLTILDALSFCEVIGPEIRRTLRDAGVGGIISKEFWFFRAIRNTFVGGVISIFSQLSITLSNTYPLMSISILLNRTGLHTQM